MGSQNQPDPSPGEDARVETPRQTSIASPQQTVNITFPKWPTPAAWQRHQVWQDGYPGNVYTKAWDGDNGSANSPEALRL